MKSVSITSELSDCFDDLENHSNDLRSAAQHLGMLWDKYVGRDDLELFWWSLKTVADNIQQYAEDAAFNIREIGDYVNDGIPIGPVDPDLKQKVSSVGSLSEMPGLIPNNGKASNA